MRFFMRKERVFTTKTAFQNNDKSVSPTRFLIPTMRSGQFFLYHFFPWDGNDQQKSK
jgi:hypothetical protein